MKHLVYGAVLLLVIFGTFGCAESPQWEETTLTIVNGSGIAVDSILVNAFGLSRATTTGMNALGDHPLADGESAVIPLPPVLSDTGLILLSACAGVDEFTFFYDDTIWPNPDEEGDRTDTGLYFRYDQGAEVTVTLIDDSGNKKYTITGAQILPPTALVF